MTQEEKIMLNADLTIKHFPFLGILAPQVLKVLVIL